MQADPKLGILQTAPQLIGATHFVCPPAAIRRLRLRSGHHARACPPGPATAATIGDTTPSFACAAFAQYCGLPRLKGRKPFGGFVLSHDFVEAALMRRGGWKVRMATDCGGSWEESPPTLIDIAIRDRRWAQGNLQHMKIIGSAGLRFISRMHLGVGIMSYLSSPLWLVMIGIGFALAVQSRLIRPEYFSHDFQLFPTWPRFDVALMMALFWFSMVVLLIPKMLGLIRALVVEPHSPRRRRRHRSYRELSARSNSVGAVRADSDGRCSAAMYSRCSWDAIPAGSRSAATPALPVGRCLALPSAPYAVELRHRGDRVSSSRRRLLAWVSPALLGLFLSVPLSQSQRQREIGQIPFATRAAAHAGRSVGTAAGRAPRGIDAQFGTACRPTDCATWHGIAKRASRISTAIWRAPRIHAAIRIRTPLPRNRN